MEAVNGVEDKGAPPPPSPLTGCYLLIVIGEPHCNEHKDIILQRVAKGLLSWDVNDCLVDLEKELAIITEQALEGEEARYGERLIQFASENLVTEILIHPVVSTLAQCVRNLLSSFTRHRHIIHAGYTFANNGSWVLQDGTFSLADFSEAFQEIEVLRVIRAYENGISLDIHCAPEGDWTRLPKEPFTKSCKVRVNPNDVLTAGSPSITNFINYLEPFLISAELESILESSDVVGNIRFSRPTLYVFPGGQGDAALFGINGFNMLLDGGFSRKACFWDFVRHLDRLDAVLLTRLNNSNVNGISAVLRRKRQNAVYPQIGHFFCNIQERKAILSPDGDKDKDPLLINLLDEGQDVVSNLRHLSLTPQVCYRDSEPINLYHKVGHGTLDMYVLSPAKDSKEVREFLQKWNNNDQKLFANQKTNKDFVFPLQNLVSVCALLVWQPANPEDTITRILFPGSTPQNKIFEGLDRIKSLEFIKHPVCSEKSIAPTTILKTKQTMLEKIIQPEKKIIDNKKEKPSKPPADNIEVELKNGEVNGVQLEKITSVKKSDSTESEKSISKPKKIIENGDKTEKPKPKPKSEAKAKPRSDSQQRKVKTADKKPSPTTPKKSVEKINGESKQKPKASPTATPAKSTKEANNRKVLESKIKAAPKKEPPKPAVEKKEAKTERKPISRRPKDISKLSGSPSKKVNGVQKPDSISRRGKLDKEGTTDSSTVSTPSADQDSILKKDISKLTTDELQNLKAQELADLKEEQEAVKEIEAVFRKGELQEDKPSDFRKIKDISIEDKLEKEEYLIIEKTEIEQDLMNGSNKEEETQKIARDSEESEKQRKLSGDTKETEIEEKRMEIQDEVQKIITSATDIVKSKDEVVEASKEVSATSPEDKIDVSTDKKDNENEMKEIAQESQPDEKGSANIESGATTTAPTLPEDERMPLDEIKEDNGDQIIEEKHVKEDTKEKDVPVIQLPPKTFDNIAKLPPVVGIRLDKQSHIRDIVKTPDEVADLPVHEEVEFDHYDDYPTSTETKTEPEEAKKEEKKDDKGEKKEEIKVHDKKEEIADKVEKADEAVKVEDKAKTEVEIKKEEVIEENESKPEDKEQMAVIKEDLNKKELSKSPDEEKDTDEHELELQKEDTKQLKPAKAEQDVKDHEEKIEVNADQIKEQEEKKEAGKTDEVKIEDSKAEIKSEEIQKEETKVGVKTEEIKKEETKGEVKTEEIKKEEPKVEVKTAEIKEEKNEPQVEIKKDETKVEVKMEESKEQVLSEETKAADKTEENKAEQVIKKESVEPVQADVKETETKKEEDKEKLLEISKDELPTPDSEKKEVVEKSETEVKEKDDLKSKQSDDDKAEKENDIGENLPEVPKDEIVVEKQTEKPVDETTKLKEDVSIIQNIDEKLQKLKEDTVEITKTEAKKPAEEITQNGKEQVELVKEDVSTIKKIDEKLQKLKEETEEEQIKAVSEVVTHKTEERQHAEPVIITADSNPESPMIDDRQIEDKFELGRKSPKEREEDVIKIVASVAEVLKSDAPLEEFEGKIPFSIPYKSYTTELRETHITTVDSPVTDEAKTIKSDEEICPKASSTYFIEEERKIAPIHEEEQEVQETKISKMMKESAELMQATSKMIQEIKQTQPKPEDIIEEEDIRDDQEVESGTVHRMLVTASSEDGGEEIEICPPGTITFSRSSESSGRSSPDPQSQKLSQKSSIADTFSDATVVTKSMVEKDLQSEVEEVSKPLDESKKDLEDSKKEVKDIKDTKPVIDEPICDTEKVDKEIDSISKETLEKTVTDSVLQEAKEVSEKAKEPHAKTDEKDKKGISEKQQDIIVKETPETDKAAIEEGKDIKDTATSISTQPEQKEDVALESKKVNETIEKEFSKPTEATILKVEHSKEAPPSSDSTKDLDISKEELTKEDKQPLLSETKDVKESETVAPTKEEIKETAADISDKKKTDEKDTKEIKDEETKDVTEKPKDEKKNTDEKEDMYEKNKTEVKDTSTEKSEEAVKLQIETSASEREESKETKEDVESSKAKDIKDDIPKDSDKSDVGVKDEMTKKSKDVLEAKPEEEAKTSVAEQTTALQTSKDVDDSKAGGVYADLSKEVKSLLDDIEKADEETVEKEDKESKEKESTEAKEEISMKKIEKDEEPEETNKVEEKQQKTEDSKDGQDTKEKINLAEDVKDFKDTVLKETEKQIEDVKDKLKDMKDDTASKIEDVKKDITEKTSFFGGIVKDIGATLVKDVSKIVEGAQKEIQDIKDLATSKIEETKEDIAAKKEFVVNVAQDIEKQLREDASHAVDSVVKETTEQKEKLMEAAKDFEETVVRDGSALLEKAKGEVEATKTVVESKVEDVKETLAEQKATLEGVVTDFGRTVTKEVEATVDEVKKEVSDAQDQAKTKIEEIGQKAIEKVDEKITDIKKEIEAGKETVDDGKKVLEDTKEKLAEQIDSQIKDVDSKTETIIEDLKAKGDELKTSVDVESKALQGKFEEKKEEIGEKLEHLAEDSTQMGSDLKDSIKGAVSEAPFVKKDVNQISAKPEDKGSQYALHNGLEAVEQMVVDVLTADREEVDTKVSEKKGITSTVENVEENIESVVEKGVSEIKEFVEDTKEAITSIFKGDSHKDEKEEVLEKSAKDIEENYNIVTDMAKSVIFEKCDMMSDEERAKDEKMLERSGQDVSNEYKAVSDMAKSITFEKCEKPLSEKEKDEKVLEETAQDIEKNYETVSNMARSIVFEKCDSISKEEDTKEEEKKKELKEVKEEVLKEKLTELKDEPKEKDVVEKPSLSEKVEIEKDTTPSALEKESTKDDQTDPAKSSGKSSPEKLEGKDATEDAASKLSGKSSPALSGDLKDAAKESSGKSTPDIKDSCHIKVDNQDSLLSGKSSPGLSGKSSPMLSDSFPPATKTESKDSLLSGKSSPVLSGETKEQPSGKSTPEPTKQDSKEPSSSSKTESEKECDKEKTDSLTSVTKSSPGASGKSSPVPTISDVKETPGASGKSSPAPASDIKETPSASGKSSPVSASDIKETPASATTGDVTETPGASGKSSPVPPTDAKKKSEDKISGTSTPDLKAKEDEGKLSGKATPDLKDKEGDDRISGTSTPDLKAKESESVVECDKKEIMKDSVAKDEKEIKSDKDEPTTEEKKEADKKEIIEESQGTLNESGKAKEEQQKEDKDKKEEEIKKGSGKDTVKDEVKAKTEVPAETALGVKDTSEKKLSISDVQISVKVPEEEKTKSGSSDETKFEEKTESKDVDSIDSGIGTEVDAKGKKPEEPEIKVSESKEESIAGPSTTSLSPVKSSEDLHLSGKSTPDIAEIEKIKEMQETLKHEKHIPGSSTPPTVPVSPIVKEISTTQSEDTKTTPPKSSTVASVKDNDIRSCTPASDDYEIGASTYSDISSGQVSRAPHLLESERIESDEEDDVPGSPMSVTSQVAHSRSSSRYDFEDDRIGTKMDPMNTSFYGALPDESELEFEKALVEHREARGGDLVTSTDEPATYLYEITKAKYSSPEPELSGQAQLDQINKNGASNLMSQSFMGDLPPATTSETKKDPFDSWGKPLGLPSPAPPNDNRGTPKKERKLPSNVSAKNKLNDDKKRSESPSKYKNKKINPVYVDLTYVPHHGNAYYSYVDFFKRVRARYYVFSGIEPSREVYNALLEAKQTWEDKELEVTIIPTYDTDILGYWVAENEELLTKYKIDLSPSASRCTINLQDHETSCSAYRLEF